MQLLKISIFLVASTTLLQAQLTEGTLPLFDSYQQMQSALAKDNFTTAKQAAKHLHSAIAKVDANKLNTAARKAWDKHSLDLRKAAQLATAATDIKALRQHFEHVSMTMISISAAGLPQGYHRFHCPMAFKNKGGDWLQKGMKAENPYMGIRMPHCGTMVKPNADHVHQ